MPHMTSGHLLADATAAEGSSSPPLLFQRSNSVSRSGRDRDERGLATAWPDVACVPEEADGSPYPSSIEMMSLPLSALPKPQPDSTRERSGSFNFFRKHSATVSPMASMPPSTTAYSHRKRDEFVPTSVRIRFVRV
jgi:hypothetical protein